MKSEEALAKIVQGVTRFQQEVYPAQRQLFEQVKHGQQPIAMFFTCADSRIDPAMLMQSRPGEIFIERTPGNIAPKYSDHVGGVTASVEFALLALHVPLIIVCGHTDCGVVKALLEPEQAAGMPALQSWMRHSLASRERLLREPRDISREEKLRLLTEYNVLTQLENLKTHPAVAAGLSKGDLALQGWVYNIGDGSISAADIESGRFELLGSAPE
ncbi:MAG: carbonic anhydrase [Candidatus Korobacteraceae bacterium]